MRKNSSLSHFYLKSIETNDLRLTNAIVCIYYRVIKKILEEKPMKKIQRLFDIDPWKIATTTLDKENRRLQRVAYKYWKWLHGDAG